MTNNRVIITYIDYLDKQHLCLFYIDGQDKPIDIINIDSTRIGNPVTAKVVKKLKNNDGICQLSDGSKGYIKSINDMKEQDEFSAVIISDSHDNKDAVIIKTNEVSVPNKITKLIDRIEYSEVITDIPIVYDELLTEKINCRLYDDEEYLLRDMYHLNKHLQEALKPRYLLKNGANIVFESTEALTVVDINSASTGKFKTTNFALDINKSCVIDIIKQLRLRCIGGIIIIDFINMDSKAQQQELIAYFKEMAQLLDPDQINIYDITHLGLMEITRKRQYKPLNQQFS